MLFIFYLEHLANSTDYFCGIRDGSFLGILYTVDGTVDENEGCTFRSFRMFVSLLYQEALEHFFVFNLLL